MIKDTQNIVIKSADDFVTNLDTVDQKSNYFRKVRGIRNLGANYVAQRDFGTIHRIVTANYPACVVSGIATIHREFTFHDNLTGYDHEILICIDTTNSRVRIFVDTSGTDAGTWLELTRTFTAKVNSPGGATLGTITIDTILENGVSLTLTTDLIKGFIVYNTTRSNSAFIISNTALTITANNYFGATGLGWQDDDNLIFFATAGHFKAYLDDATAFTTTLLGATPHFEFNPIGEQRKVNVYYGNSNDTPTMQKPVQIMNRPARNYFQYTTPYYETIGARWDMEAMGGGLTPSFTEIGTISTPIVVADGVQTISVTDQNASDIIMQITVLISPTGTPTTEYKNLNIYITLLYADYEESDPVAKIHAKMFVTDATNYLIVTPKIDFSKLNKEITGIRLYGEYATKAEVESGAYLTRDAGANYKDISEITIRGSSFGSWTKTSTDGMYIYSLALTIDYTSVDVSSANNSILDNLRHAISTSRTIKKPRFGTTTTRSENPLSIIDADDRTLLYSTLDGDGTVEDDNFAEAGADNTGSLLKANLLGSLAMRAFANQNNQIHVFRQASREIVNPQNGYQDIRKCDFYASRSVVSSPLGLVWCGYSSIYFVPMGDVSEYPINLGWQNLYDGTLKIDDGSVPYITDTYRSAIIAGWDQTFREFWFHCQVNKDAVDGGGSEYLCFRYSPDYKRWTIRQLNIGTNASYPPIVAFSQRSDGTMSIIYTKGVLKYPNRDASKFQYSDSVISSGASVGNGIPTSFKLIIGEIADKIKQNVLLNILPDYKGSSISTTGRLQINLYANKEATAYDTQYFPVDTPEDSVRMLEERDNISELAVEVLIPTADLVDVKDLDISSLYLGLLKKLRLGNS